MEQAVRHGSTFGGNDLAAAAGAGDAAGDRARRPDRRAERMGALLLELTTPLIDRHEIVRDVRGLGLMWAIELGPPAGGAAARSSTRSSDAQPGLFAQLITVPLFHEHRILCQVAGHRMNVVKALPVAADRRGEVRRFADALEEVVAAAERVPRAMARFGVQMARGTARARRGRRLARMMRALVTGAAGFIGAPRRRRAGRWRCASPSVRSPGRSPDRCPTTSSSCRATCSTPKPCDERSTVATRSSTSPPSTATLARDAALMQAVNVEGTRTVLDAALRGRRRRIVHTSSCATCGPVPGRQATERDLPPPRELEIPYKRTKLEGERLDAGGRPAGRGRRRRQPDRPRSAPAISGRPRPARWSPTSRAGAPAATSPGARSTSSPSRTSRAGISLRSSAAAPASATCSAARTWRCATCSP